MRTFYSAQDIEDLAARGATQLEVDETVVLTDLARDAAQRLGVRLVSRAGGAVQAPTTAPPARAEPVAPAVTRALRSGAKPAGCQHAPLSSGLTATVQPQTEADTRPAAANPNTVVDQVVGLVRQLAGKR